MSEPIEKGVGLNAAEKFLKDLCDKTFLSLWSFPNLFKRKGDELCDLLIVFEDHVVIFSNKSCAFKRTGNLEVDWNRWFTKAVAKSAEQAFGAERWLKEQPGRIFLDAKCTRPFPLRLPPRDKMKVHRIVVALGAGEACRDFYEGPGSLMLQATTSPEGKRLPTLGPFSVGWVLPDRPFVHVLDDVNLGLLLRELNTASDLVAYLEKKEALLARAHVVMAPGEEDLLASYLFTPDGDRGAHKFPFDEAIGLFVDEGMWEKLVASPEYIAKRKADQVSGMWDALIEVFAHSLAEGTLESRGSMLDESIHNTERSLRAMASEPRLARRVLAHGLLDLYERTPPDSGNTRMAVSPSDSTKAYVYCLRPVTWRDADYEEYRERRRNRLVAYMLVVRHLHPNLKTIVGIASEPRGSHGSSQDLAFLDGARWPPELAAEGRRLHEEGGLFRQQVRSEIHVQEFPSGGKPPSDPRPNQTKAPKERMNRARRRAGR